MSLQRNPVHYPSLPTPDGDWVAMAPLTPSDDTRDKIVLGKPCTIPVLFIPGIMGSNLMKKDGSIAWRPPNTDARGALNAIAQLFEYLFKGTRQRARELNTEEARIDPRGPIDAGMSGLAEDVLRARRWGTVLRASYHPFMARLQHHLNSLSEYVPATGAVELRAWAAGQAGEGPAEWGGQGGEPLAREEILRAARYRFDVWGGGYNWLQGNSASGGDIRDYIEKVILPYYNEGKGAEGTCADGRACKIRRPRAARALAEKVIVVTHSMGGLVSRALTEIHQCDKVLGVSHGVQPATGAPDTYKRMRAGAEGLAQLFLGRNAADLTAILSQAQGGLELLPAADYDGGRPWLKAREKAAPGEGDGGAGISLPARSDPYAEIYKSPQWYGLVPRENEALMNPAEGETGKSGEPSKFVGQSGPRDALNNMIDRVQEFHAAIQGRYKSPTYAHYGGQGFRGRTGSRGGLLGTGLGAGGEHRHAFGQVVWAGPGGGQVRPEAALWSDDRNGRLEVGGVRLSIAGPDAPGDGTVPAQSGAAPDGQPGVEMVFAHGQGHPGRHNLEFGYDHQDACNDERALYATLYAIVKIAQRADWYEAKKEAK